MTGRWLYLFVAGCFGYLLLDGHPESWLNGLPWRPLSLGVAVLGGILMWVAWPRSDPDADATGSGRLGRRVLAALAIGVCLLAGLKGVVGAQSLQSGLPGWYFDNSRFQGDMERSSDFLGGPWTRREREVFFGGDEFPNYFFNDVQRFNFYGEEAERRKNLPFSVRWDGHLYVPADGTYQLWLTASGPAALRLDGKQIASVDADGRETRGVSLPLTAGSHAIRITYARRPPRSPDLKMEWDVGGERQPLRVPYLFPSEVSPAQWAADRTLLSVSRGLDVLFLAFGTVGLLGLIAASSARAWRRSAARWPLLERTLLGAWASAIFYDVTVPRLDRLDKLNLLGGGQDWLTHESFARDILINGPLMTLGKALGEGRTFYAQPFYPYALAGFHALTGEDQFGVVALQVFQASISGILLYFLAKRLFGQIAAVVAFALYLPLWSGHLEWVSHRLISEAIYFTILTALLLALVRCLDHRRAFDFALAGLLLGLAIVTRGPTLLYVPFVGAILWWGIHRIGGSGALAARRLSLLFACMMLVVGLVPLRNYLVAGQPAFLASSGGVNLQKLHRPTNDVRLNRAQDRWFAPYIQDAPTRETVEFLLQDPAGYAWATALLAAYTLGYGAAVEESFVTVWPELIGLNAVYLLTILLFGQARSLRSGLLHAFVLIHFATMIVFVPYDYDNRLVLPMYLPITVIAAGGVAAFLAWAACRVRPVQDVGRSSRPAVLSPQDAETS